jgi:hypothetical protein
MKQINISPSVETEGRNRIGNISESNSPFPKAINEYDAAKIVGKAVQSLRNDRHLCKGLPYIKMGKSVRYLIADINEYLLAHRIEPLEL